LIKNGINISPFDTIDYPAKGTKYIKQLSLQRGLFPRNLLSRKKRC